MNLSDLFGGGSTKGFGASDYVVITGAVTNSIITNSPAILTSVTAGGLQTGGTTGSQYYYSFQVFDGTNIVCAGVGYPSYPNISSSQISCPNGIKVTTAELPGYGSITLARLSIGYVLA